MREPSARYQRIMEASGLEVEELDRQRDYIVDSMDGMAIRIAQLERQLESSEGMTPSDDWTGIWMKPGVKVNVTGVGTYCFPEGARVTMRNAIGGENWSLHMDHDAGRDVLKINGPRLAVMPRASNDIEVRQAD